MAALGTGCTRTEEPAPAQTPASPAARRSAINEELMRTPPRVEELFITPLDELHSSTLTRLEVRFAEGTELPEAFEVFPDDDQVAVLRDDGQDGDEQAGDGLFTLEFHLDFDELIAQDERVGQLQDEFGDELTVPLVSGRSIIDRLPPFRLDFDVLRPFERFPIRIPINGFPLTVNKDRSLFITDERVLGDPERTADACNPQFGDSDKKWTFGYLMKQMAGSHDPAVFAREWLKHWEEDQGVNGWNVPARADISRIIQQWENLGGGTLDPDFAPFKLLAIVNRVDLAENSFYGGPAAGAGEGRFVFAWVDENCQPQQFTVIFEYLIPARGCFQLKDWAQQWRDLDLHEPGGPDYNAALEAITEQFAAAGAMPGRPNDSALNQLRTNDVVLESQEKAELREFKLDEDGLLRQVPVAQTPDSSLNGASRVANYVNAHLFNILSETHQVPLAFGGSDFLGGSSLYDGGFFWDAPGISDNEARHKFSLKTCNGCHAGETGTDFTHLDVNTGAPSSFLTGIGWPSSFGHPDPKQAAGPGPVTDHYLYGDLDRRAADVDALLNNPCVFRIPHLPILGGH
jgi:hypothetical protein